MVAPTGTIEDLLAQLYIAETSDDCLHVADQLAEGLLNATPASPATTIRNLIDSRVLENLQQNAQNKKDGLKRESALIGYYRLFDAFSKHPEVAATPFFLQYLPVVLDTHADKGQVVRDAAVFALEALCSNFRPEELGAAVWPAVRDYFKTDPKWQSKIAALSVLAKFPKISKEQVQEHLVDLIPAVQMCMHDTKAEASEAAIACMKGLLSTVENLDIKPHLSLIVECMAKPTQVPSCIKALSAQTFVAEVNAPVLAILVPILVRALNERSQEVLRQTVIVADNLCRLVKDPLDAARFLPELMPLVQERVVKVASMPEVRALATKAHNTMVAAGAEAKVADVSHETTPQQVRTLLESLVAKKLGWKPPADSVSGTLYQILSLILAQMVNNDRLSTSTWTEVYVGPYMAPVLGTSKMSLELGGDMVNHYLEEYKKAHPNEFDDDEAGEKIVDVDFSLAYGGMMLLNHTHLRLYRGRRYGIVAHNGAGKSTLMRAIATGKLEGFPSPEEVRTCFVEHNLQGSESVSPILDFVAEDEELVKLGITKEQTAATLLEVGFTPERQAAPVSSLSGGWRMKLSLARAMLMNVDVLLLDEPTNHLDVTNIAWLESYLNSQNHITSMIVSHDSKFLDNVCTDIIHYERKKLAYYRGNLSAFVDVHPEAKSYYTLDASNVKFKFPPPGILSGIKSNTKAIMRMTHCHFTYPGAAKKSLDDVSATLTLSSRVAVIGANGAGKSTLIKVLTGEVIPQEGTVDKHPNLRVGYVAQHAFHHVEQHMDLTPNQYIQWRYAGGEDREVLEKASRILTDEEKAQLDTPFVVQTPHGEETRKVEMIIGRQKLKKTFQYEVKWQNMGHKFNLSVPRDRLIEKGFAKMVQRFDDYLASKEGLGYRELSPAVIRKHFEEIGLDGDIADHNAIRGLSGGQKVKVVIAAAMWNNPHLLVLDEPTNYLDRDSLGGLAVAIRDWAGGVVIISHSSEFVGALCPEQWIVENGKVISRTKDGIDESKFLDKGADEKAPEPETGAIGKARKKKKMTRNDKKAQEERRRLRHIAWLSSAPGTPKYEDTDDE
ncbi:[NU+] prion formation protein 1 [Saitoella coloradoensis]